MQLPNMAQKFYLWNFGVTYTVTSFDFKKLLPSQSAGAGHSQRQALPNNIESACVEEFNNFYLLMQFLSKCKRFGTQSVCFPSDSDFVICAP